MKIFISQPMNGLTEEQIKDKRDFAIRQIELKYPDKNIEILESYFNDFNGSPIEFLAESLKVLAKADMAVFMKGYNKARGCIVEHEVCKQYNIPRTYMNI